MISEKEILLVIAAYLRKANHPTESDLEIAQGVIVDLAKIHQHLQSTHYSAIKPDEYEAGQ